MQDSTFKEACDEGRIAGGLVVPGFTFNVHRFVDNLLMHLEEAGVLCRWNTTVRRIQTETGGRVSGLLTNSGAIRADHYSLHPGAYGDHELLQGTPAEERIGGVAGRWLVLPRPASMRRRGVKIHGDARSESGASLPVVDLNLTPRHLDGAEKIIVGGGYVYVGNPPFPMEESAPAFRLIDTENERIVTLFLGKAYRHAVSDGSLARSDATCVRSFSDNDEPLCEQLPTANGGVLTIDGGTNTGTTTAAPFIAQSVVERIGKARN